MDKYFSRNIDKSLETWKHASNRKPLLLRGARQVGKSSAARYLGASFKYFIEINLEKHDAIKALFTSDIDVKKFCTQLSSIINTPIIAGQTLLFIDEIQGVQKAISYLRYFYEDFPELHVIAAGSLLEFALNELPSFGVGRIRSMYMYPFTFDEFLTAQGLAMQVNYKRDVLHAKEPLPMALHNEMVYQLRSYYLVGGMPEAVRTWVQTSSYKECAMVHNDILETYRDDFVKYKTRVSPLLINQALVSVAIQVGNKFVYKEVNAEVKSSTVKEALSLLSLAGLIFPVYHTAANGIPLGAEINAKYVKYLFLDVGLMQTLLNINPGDIILSNEIDFINKGGFAENFVGLELIKHSEHTKRPELYYWQRMERNAQAEVDYIVIRNHAICPIEVKASTSGSMQSMYKFLKLKNIERGIRVSLEQLATYNNITVIPLYGVGSL